MLLATAPNTLSIVRPPPIQHVVEQRGRDETHARTRVTYQRRRPQSVFTQPVGRNAVESEQRQDADDQERATARVQRPHGEKKDAEHSEHEKRPADRRLLRAADGLG